MIIQPRQDESKDIEMLATRVFMKTIDLLGGLSKLADYRTLTWLPSLARASFAVVLREEYGKTEDEIARTVGLSRNAVRNILRANVDLALKRLGNLEELSAENKKDLRVHIAGAIAKLAFEEVKQGKEANFLLAFAADMLRQVAGILEVPWVTELLNRLKDARYPIEKSEDILPLVEDMEVKGEPMKGIVEKLTYPIHNVASLVEEVKKASG
ncbi:bacterio-opsin activator [bacterium]|nr:bacterio-opsin activator [bacterium]